MKLTPKTYGYEIKPPFENAELIEDGKGDELFDISSLKLTPVLKSGEEYITVKEAWNRCNQIWGQRAAEAITKAGNEGKISLEVWPLYEYAVFGKTKWRYRLSGGVCGWYVVRGGGGFDCHYYFVDDDVSEDGRILSCKSVSGESIPSEIRSLEPLERIAIALEKYVEWITSPRVEGKIKKSKK